MIDPRRKAMRSIAKSVEHGKDGHANLAIAAGLRALAWAILHVAEQLKRQADFWERGA